jgi:hypothetical protein
MPDSLVALLKRGVGYNHLEGVVPVVAQMLQQSAATRHAYLCHPCVQHISKLRKEGMLRSSIDISYCVSFAAKAAPRRLLWVPQHSDAMFVHRQRRVSGVQQHQ